MGIKNGVPPVIVLIDNLVKTGKIIYQFLC